MRSLSSFFALLAVMGMLGCTQPKSPTRVEGTKNTRVVEAPADTKPGEAKPNGEKKEDAKPADANPAEGKPPENKPGDNPPPAPPK